MDDAELKSMVVLKYGMPPPYPTTPQEVRARKLYAESLPPDFLAEYNFMFNDVLLNLKYKEISTEYFISQLMRYEQSRRNLPTAEV